MNEYQILVSFNGKFLFKTEWTSYNEDVNDTFLHLRKVFTPELKYNIRIFKRINTSTEVTDNFI